MTFFRTATAVGAMSLTALALSLNVSAPSAAQSLADTRSELIDDLPPQDWLNVVERTEKGYRNGNPEAEAQLIEFISYTCSHCADFAKQGDSTLDIAAVGPGHVAVEVRPVIRNYLDLVVSLLVQCGEPAGFKGRHRAFLYAQDTWLSKALNAPQSQKQIWAREDANARVNASRALGFDDIMRDRGFSMSQISACLRDEARAQKIVANDEADRIEFSITGTPTFALDGEALPRARLFWVASYRI